MNNGGNGSAMQAENTGRGADGRFAAGHEIGKATRWAAGGASPNPLGRPLENFVSVAKRVLDETADAKLAQALGAPEAITKREALVRRLWQLAMQGSMRAASLILDRTDAATTCARGEESTGGIIIEMAVVDPATYGKQPALGDDPAQPALPTPDDAPAIRPTIDTP